MFDRVMVTGGAGFIGSELVRQIVDKGAQAIVVDNLVNGRRENLAGVPEDGMRLEVADIRDESRMSDLMKGIDVVFHLACLGVRHSIGNPHENHEVNATGTLGLLTAARDRGVDRFVYVSTSEVYGTARSVPMAEEHPTFPHTVYGASKLAGECYARAFHSTYGYPTVMVRPFNTFGPRCHHEGDSGEVIPKFLLRTLAGLPMVIFGDGNQTRDFLHVTNTAAGILAAGLSELCIGETINLGSGKEISIRDLAGAVAKVTGQDKPQIAWESPRPGDVLRLYADSSKAKQLLSFEPSVSLEQGLVALKEWYKGMGKTPSELLEDEVVKNWEMRKDQALGRKFIPIAKPLLDRKEASAVRRVIRSGWVTQGPEVAALEKEFAEFVGAGHACAVSNCTTALHLALLAVGVRPGDEVITVSHSFIATANAIRHCGAVPVFVDIDGQTFNMDPDALMSAFTDRTKAVLCVHQMGMPADMDRICEIADTRSIPVVEDAACALGSEILSNGLWNKIGNPMGDVVCFSFHPRKVITTGDGGMLTTNRSDLDAFFRLMRHQGMSVSDAVRHASSKVVFEEYPVVGYNYRLTDLQAALGREQLRRLPEIVATRRNLANHYTELLSQGWAGIVPLEPLWARSNWQSYCVRLPAGCDQKSVMQHMLDRQVATRKGIMCIHRERAYSDAAPRFALDRSTKAQDNCIVLPLYPEMTREDQEYVVSVLKEACSLT